MESFESNIPKRKTITLVITEACNLNCVYCYESHKSSNRMTLETACHILRDELTRDDGFEEVEIDFFGGEPFLEFETIKRCCEFVWSNNWDKKIICYICTNGTLVHGEIKEWLMENKDKVWCGLSLDGTRDMHNLNRSNSYDKIDFRFFHDLWPTQPVKMTISELTLPTMAKGIIEIHNMGFLLNANLAYGLPWEDKKFQEIYEEQISILIDYYLEHPDVTPCKLVDMGLGYLPYFNLERTFKWCGASEFMHTYDHTGICYPCQFFLPLSVGEEKARQSLTIDFSNKSSIMDPMCDGCCLLPICPTCYGSNYLETGSIGSRNKHLCTFTKISALASSYYHYKRIMTSVKKGNVDISQQDKDILLGVKIVQRKVML